MVTRPVASFVRHRQTSVPWPFSRIEAAAVMADMRDDSDDEGVFLPPDELRIVDEDAQSHEGDAMDDDDVEDVDDADAAALLDDSTMRFDGHTDAVYWIAFSPNEGNFVATACGACCTQQL